MGNSIVYDQKQRALTEQLFALNKALGEGLTAQEMARFDASMEATNRELADRIDASATARLAALNAQQMSETRATIEARAAATIDAAARTASMHAGVTASNAQRDAIMQARQVNALNATNAAIARGMAAAHGNARASGVDFGAMTFTPAPVFDFNNNLIAGAAYGLGELAVDTVVGTMYAAGTLVGAGLDARLRPFGVDYFSGHTEALLSGLSAVGDFLAHPYDNSVSAVSHHFFEPLGNAYEAYQAGEYFEAGRIGVRPIIDAVGVGYGVGGVARTAAGSLAELRAALGQYRLEAVDVPYAFGQSGALGVRVTSSTGAGFYDRLATLSTKNPDSAIVVLGKFDEGGRSYTRVAAHYNASYLKIQDYRSLSQSLGPEGMLRVNEAFLDQQLSAGKQIVLSHDPARATGAYYREVAYLRALGYQFVQDGWVWRAVR